MIDVERINETGYLVSYIATLDEKLKQLTLDDVSIKSGMEKYEHIPSGCMVDKKIRVLLVADYVEDYQAIRVFQWDFRDYENQRLYDGGNLWTYTGVNKNPDAIFNCKNFAKGLSELETKKLAIVGDGICPIGRLHPILVRNGLTMELLMKFCHNIGQCSRLIDELINNPIIEKLIKAKQYEFCKFMLRYNTDIGPVLRTLKICCKHHYIIEDVDMWSDYIVMLNLLGKDTLNPQYICPPNLPAAHNAVLNEWHSKGIKRNNKMKKVYEEWASQYENIVVEDDKYTIHPIVSVQEMKEEGEIMDHCVYIAGYYEKAGQSIILSCRDKLTNERVATIECNMQSLDRNDSIIQIRGSHNSEPKDYDEINLLAHQWFEQAIGGNNGQGDCYISGESGGIF